MANGQTTQGWEYLFHIDFGTHAPTAERLLQLVNYIGDAEAFNHALPTQIDVIPDFGSPSRIQLGDKISKREEANKIFHQIAKQYRYNDAGYTLSYNLPLYTQMWEEQMPQKQPHQRQFVLPPREDGVEVLRFGQYNAGDLRHYRDGRTRKLNMELLMTELACIAESGVRDIRGLNLHRDREPHRHSAVYHHEFGGYLEDIYIITGEFYEATETAQEIVLETLFSQEVDLKFKDTKDLPIVFNTGGTNGDLRHFYEKLLTRLRNSK